MSRDWCKFFADIEADPRAKIKDFSIRDMLYAKEHLYGCDTCNNRVERVNAKNPNQSDFTSYN